VRAGSRPPWEGGGENARGQGKEEDGDVAKRKEAFLKNRFSLAISSSELKDVALPATNLRGSGQDGKGKWRGEVVVYPKVLIRTKRQVPRPLYVINLFIKSIV
jgi:hypothetical protein